MPIKASSEVGNSNTESEFLYFDSENLDANSNPKLTSKSATGNARVYESAGQTLSVAITGNSGGTSLAGVAAGGTSPYTYAWTKVQNANGPVGATGIQSATTPTTATTAITVASPSSDGTTALWKLRVTDANGAKIEGFYMNITAGV